MIAPDSPISAFAVVLENCRRSLAETADRVEDYLGLFPEEVTWSNVAEASLILSHLERAAAATVPESTEQGARP